MKKLTKNAIAVTLLAASASASAELSLNVGAMSDYWFRGIDQTENNASLMAGADYDFGNGFYVGTWGAQLDDAELEYDLYGGYSGSYEDLSYGVGYAGYFYTDSDVSTYHELIFSAGYKFLSADFVLGTEDADDSANDADYTFFSLSGEYEGAYLTYGVFGEDYEGDYVEAGYGTSFQGLDMSLAYIKQLDTELDGDGEKDSELVFTISKTFDL
ncbi:hypothetical protein H9C73_08770 [Marinobacterium sp. AK62]|uniref:Outer membrane protein beta-barrel domain-containing protein n=1 Tax=Marinobacterium alkalitolerans TaxID=1542925 RepID=A0ABS3ZAW5_9GAMM|nr:TorF family putative porin [Marinobacterium alkalitolerans]MBP0048829.1 hypothetical protein [Marinobacterium alkalitolerans]